MKYLVTLLLICCSSYGFSQLWDITELASMPMKSANNAVCEGQQNGDWYVYSFGGIDTSKKFNGIHQKSFRYHIESDTWESIPDLPDTLGKIAAAANRVGDTIYIFGGYHVFANHNEISSNKVHRFNTQTNSYMTDGAPIPRAIDDHVQAVWRDSLIFLITGWSNNTNYPDVQVYNPYTDTWKLGTFVPNTSQYKMFGASGTILGDTIYYFGGASTGLNFPASNGLIKGAITATKDTIMIKWTREVLDNNIKGYRMASIAMNSRIFWLGGSAKTYNYDGIAYDNSGGVSPSNMNLYYIPEVGAWDTSSIKLPMDLRGAARISNYEAYIVGGMEDNQQVSNKLYRLNYQWLTNLNSIMKQKEYSVYPNPCNSFLQVQMEDFTTYKIYNSIGQLMKSGTVINHYVHFQLPEGLYFLETIQKGNRKVTSFTVVH